jgi:hypothetical protein
MKPTLNIRLKRQRHVYGDGWKLGPARASQVNEDVRATQPYEQSENVKLFLVHVVCWLFVAGCLAAQMSGMGLL